MVEAAQRSVEPPTDVKTLLRALGPAAPLLVASTILPALGGFLLLGFLPTVGEYLRSHGEIAPLLYIGGLALLTGLALLPTYASAILGGWALGFTVGFPAAMGGIMLATLLAYAIGRTVAAGPVLRLIHSHPRWMAIYRALVRANRWRTLLLVTLVRLAPNSPFAVCNFALSAAGVPLWSYAVAVLGMAPRTAAVVYAASNAQQLSFSSSDGWWMFAASLVVLLVLASLIQRFARGALQQFTATHPAA